MQEAAAAQTSRCCARSSTRESGLGVDDFAHALATALDYRFVSAAELAHLEPDFCVTAAGRGDAPLLPRHARSTTSLVAVFADPFDTSLRGWLELRIAAAARMGAGGARGARQSHGAACRGAACHRRGAAGHRSEARRERRRDRQSLATCDQRGHQPGGAPGALHPVRRAARRRERHPPGDAPRRAWSFVTASTACWCSIAQCRGRRACRAGHLAHQGDVASSTSPSAACRRTAASRSRSRARPIDFRVSIMPSIFGEDAVLRMLDKQALTEQMSGLRLDVLGFDARRRSASCAGWRAALRHAARHRAHRQRQDDDAVRGDLRDQHRPRQDRHDRGPGRVPAARRAADSRSTRRRA